MVSGGQVLFTILDFVYLLMIETSGIDYKLYIGAIVTAMLILVIAVSVTCLVTWRHGSGNALIIVRRGRVGNFSNHQVAACAQATIHKPPNLARSTSAQTTSINKRKKKDPNSLKRSVALGYRHSKSMSNLNTLDVEISPFTVQMRRQNYSALSASCSALDLPLPPQPARMSTLYEDKEYPRRSDSLSVNQNVAYTTNRDIDSRPPCPPPYSKSPQPSHLYEQLDLVESSNF